MGMLDGSNMQRTLLAAGLIVFSLSAWAEDPNQLYLDPNSNRYEVTFDRETPACIAHASVATQSGRQVGFETVFRFRSGVFFQLGLAQWANLENIQLEIDVHFSNGYHWNGSATLNNGMLMWGPGDDEFGVMFAAWAESDGMTIRFAQDASVDWPLDGSMDAFNALLACHLEHQRGPGRF